MMLSSSRAPTSAAEYFRRFFSNKQHHDDACQAQQRLLGRAFNHPRCQGTEELVFEVAQPVVWRRCWCSGPEKHPEDRLDDGNRSGTDRRKRGVEEERKQQQPPERCHEAPEGLPQECTTVHEDGLFRAYR
jgi:hypothetical protein